MRALRPGQATLLFGENTAVFANDGLGTNVLRNTIGASYLVVDNEMLAGPNPLGPLLFSPTHPNLTRWYNQRTTIFNWWNPDVHKYKYILSKDKDVAPEGDFIETDSTATFEVEEDGVYYFHLLAEDTLGTVSRSEYPIKIDSTPPDTPLIKASTLEIVAGEVVRFEFSSNDELSGLQNGFYVKLRKNGVFFPSGPQLFVAFPEKGEHEIVVRVFDRANNFSESFQVINVK